MAVVLDQLANGLDTAVPQVVNVIWFFHPIVDQDHALDNLDQV
jgi:hypothetical protein